MSATEPRTYHYRFNGHAIDVTRRHVRTAYARNGNVHNPTEYFMWTGIADGKVIDSLCQTRWEAYEAARQYVAPTSATRPFWIVQEEMRNA